MSLIKKLIVFSIVCCLWTGWIPANAYTMKAGLQSKKIPRGTILELQMAEPVTTQDMVLGDSFDSKLINDLIIDSKVLLPSGTIIRGTISEVTPNKRLSRGAKLYMKFDYIVTVAGRQIPLKAGLCALSGISMMLDGGLSGGNGYGDALKNNLTVSGNIIKNATQWGLDSGDNILNGSGKYILAPVGAIAGTTIAGFYFVGDSIIDLFRKGNDIIIPQGQLLNILLLDDVDIPLS